jgi:hypothetical protein
MPISPIQRITSQTTNVVGVSGNRTDAITALTGGTLPNVISVGNTPLIWPELRKYDNDNSTFSTVPDPEFIWTTNPQPGDVRAFAVSSEPIPVTIGVGQDFVINLAVFTDNAHNVQIDSLNAGSLVIVPTTNLGVTLTDGSMDVNTGTTEIIPPFNWQFVRYYSIPVSLGAVFIGLNVQFVFSFEAVNYSDPATLAENPAGLAFVADIYQSTLL